MKTPFVLFFDIAQLSVATIHAKKTILHSPSETQVRS